MAKVQSQPMLCILCAGDGSRDLILSKLAKNNIDVVEQHRLDDGFTVLVVGVESLPPMVEYYADQFGWITTMNRRAFDLFLSETKRGTPSNRIFTRWK